MEGNIYLDLTRAFNAGRLRCIVSSGQAVVLHRLAVMSKDGDWIAREDAEALHHVLSVLEARGARYRLGAPLDMRWMAGGWSAHFEFVEGSTLAAGGKGAAGPLRVRTDFVTRPPRLSPADLAELWREQQQFVQQPASQDLPVVDVRRLAVLKETNRERDYAVIGELARRLPTARAQLLFSRSARDLAELAGRHPALIAELSAQRPVLAQVSSGREALEIALDAERRILMRLNEARLQIYAQAARHWYEAWPHTERLIDGLPLRAAHEVLVERAALLLPFEPLEPAQAVAQPVA